ncbi:MAG: hypothetical protein M1834_008085 [Cirrosporium novae-zelandiae]|nr:MAG: hypothetical protein M1834_008085 [Cirrosporium novae-zelandiae]
MAQNSKKHSHRPSSTRHSSGHISHRTTLSLQKTEILINAYDLLPPGRISSVLWVVGSSLLHSGVVIGEREYAYGGHNKPNASGVYWTKPRQAPPGGTFRCEILHGFTIRPDSEIEEIIAECSRKFLGTNYNLLTNNCNHFTSYLCERLTSRPAPSWLNRAASIGVALPCVVPREWIQAPDHDTAGGELLDEDDDDDERSAMLKHDRRRPQPVDESSDDSAWNSEDDRRKGGNGKGKGLMRDTEGRRIPPADRAPRP